MAAENKNIYYCEIHHLTSFHALFYQKYLLFVLVDVALLTYLPGESPEDNSGHNAEHHQAL